MRKVFLYALLISLLGAGAFEDCLNKNLNKPHNHSATKAEKLSLTSFTCKYKGKLDITGLRELKNLKNLILVGNVIKAPLPTWIGELKKLTYVNVSGNAIMGKIPKEIGSLTKLKHLDLSSNLFVKASVVKWVDGNFTTISSVEALNSNDYNISSNKGYLEFIQDFNAYIGLNSIPKEIGNLLHLEELHLENSHITSYIPKEIGNLTKLKKLYMQDNKLFGTIPKELGNLTHLTKLRLDHNSLRGTIPQELIDTNLTSPAGLNLKHNCNLETDNNNTKNWINQKSSFYGGYDKVKTTGGHCYTPVMTPIILYLLTS